jgi:septal ring factor EnvC (AmiA/AmiB activator)
MNQCRATKANKERCKLQAGESGYCWAHDPKNAEQVRRRASKGGRSRVGQEVHGLRLQLQELTRDVRNGDVKTSIAAVANQLITTQIKLLEYERRSSDLDELLERLERLEDARRAG